MYTETVAPSTLSKLEQIASLPELQDYRLVGGTSLSLQIGHRISIDLDFFGPTKLDTGTLMPKLEKIGNVTEYLDNDAVKTFYLDDLKIDFVEYKYPWISQMVKLGSANLCGIPDIAAMKVSAIGQRATKKDFFDMYMLLQTYDVGEVMDFFRQKYPKVNDFHYMGSELKLG